LSYRIEFKKSAQKEFLELSRQLQDRTVNAVQLVATNPFSELIRVKKLRGPPNLCRIRLGDWRIVYELFEDKALLGVVKIGHRKEVYRFLKE